MNESNDAALKTLLLDALEQEVVGEPNTPALVGRVRLLLKGQLYQAGIRNPTIDIQQSGSAIHVRIRYQAGPTRVRTIQLTSSIV